MNEAANENTAGSVNEAANENTAGSVNETANENAEDNGNAAANEKPQTENAALSGDGPYVTVNGQQVCLMGKKSYVFVDVFEFIDFDLSKPQGSGIVTKLNGRDAQYMETIHGGDVIEIYWKH